MSSQNAVEDHLHDLDVLIATYSTSSDPKIRKFVAKLRQVRSDSKFGGNLDAVTLLRLADWIRDIYDQFGGPPLC